jgi:hypothetical protein
MILTIGYVRASDVEPYLKTLLIDGKGVADRAYPVEG